MKRMISILLCFSLLGLLTACGGNETNSSLSESETLAAIQEEYPDAHLLSMNGNEAALDGEALKEYDYVWHYDPSMESPEYSGETPDVTTAYIAHDLIYYPEIDASSFEKASYDGENEWVTHYAKEGLTEYLFSTLPVSGDELPVNMMHSEEEAYANPVLHITQPGQYILEGTWNGQINIDLGEEECAEDESKKVTLILNGVDVTCTAAPALIFEDLYECDHDWESREEQTGITDLSNAGAKVVLVDGSENTFTGANVYRLLKAEYKKDGSDVQKKLLKLDGAFYSCVSLLIEGKTGILNINSSFEGLDSELHLTINGGYVNIISDDDGINVNEDHVSVFTLQDGRLTIFAGQGSEGDVIDSNGYINVFGGTIAGTSPSVSDEILDSEDGTTVSEQANVISSLSGMRGDAPMRGDPPGAFDEPMPFGPDEREPFGKPSGDRMPGEDPPELLGDHGRE